jgi:hypothetical protein
VRHNFDLNGLSNYAIGYYETGVHGLIPPPMIRAMMFIRGRLMPVLAMTAMAW